MPNGSQTQYVGKGGFTGLATDPRTRRVLPVGLATSGTFATTLPEGSLMVKAGIRKVGDLYITPSGRAFDNLQDALNFAAARGELNEQQLAFKAQIERAGEEQLKFVERRGAQQTGLLARTAQAALLSGGESPEKIEAIRARIQAAGTRGTLGQQEAIRAGTAQALAGAEKFGITGTMGLEDVRLQQQGLTQAQRQFQQEMALRQRELAQQPTFIQQLLGQGAEGVGKGASMLLLAKLFPKFFGIPIP